MVFVFYGCQVFRFEVIRENRSTVNRMKPQTVKPQNRKKPYSFTSTFPSAVIPSALMYISWQVELL